MTKHAPCPERGRLGSTRAHRWAGSPVAVAVLLAAVTVFAEDATPPKVAAEAVPAETPPAARPSGMSAEEQQAQSTKFLVEMRATETHVAKLAERARNDKDLIKLNCLNDKLLQIKGNLRIAEQTSQLLSVAAARGDAAARDHEFSKITITYQKVSVLGQEAEGCVGEEVAYVGEARVTVEIDPNVAGAGDPTEQEPEPLPTIRPPVASPVE